MFSEDLSVVEESDDLSEWLLYICDNVHCLTMLNEKQAARRSNDLEAAAFTAATRVLLQNDNFFNSAELLP